MTSLPISNPVTHQPLSVYDFEPEGDSGFWFTDPDAELMFWDRRGGRVENVIFHDEDGRKIRLRVETLFHDGAGYLWLMTHDGVYVMDPSSRRLLRRHYVADSPHQQYLLLLQDAVIRDMVRDKGRRCEPPFT